MSTHFQGLPQEKLVLDTWIKFSRAKSTIDTQMRKNVEEQGLTLSQFGVLEILLHRGPLRVKEIGEKLLLTPSNLVTVVDNLVKQQLVKRVPCKEDRRAIYIHLMDQGRAIIEPVFANHLIALKNCFAPLDSSQLEELGSLCKTLGLANNHKVQEK